MPSGGPTSAVMIPSTPVNSIHLSASDRYKMLPFAKTGTLTARLTALICSQSARPCEWNEDAIRPPSCHNERENAHRHLTLHLPRASMTSQNARPRSFHHLGILDGLVDVPEYPEFRRDGYGEVFMEDVDCASSVWVGVGSAERREEGKGGD
jgi:hypothetical protein